MGTRPQYVVDIKVETVPGRTSLCERQFLHLFKQWVFPLLTAKKDPLKAALWALGRNLKF